jgi:hypothetical protein
MILFVGHDASLTGAPKSLLLIIENISKNYNEPISIILKEGEINCFLGLEAMMFPSHILIISIILILIILGTFIYMVMTTYKF